MKSIAIFGLILMVGNGLFSQSPPVKLAAIEDPAAEATRAGDAAVTDRIRSLARHDDFTELLFDTTQNGTVWVRGKDYKASFSKDEVSFIPFLGSHAPRNFPVTFKMIGVGVGGELIAPVASREAVREGQAILIDRGMVTEIYELRLDQVEQMFRLARSLGAGDVTVRLSVETELSVQATGDGGFEFRNELGGVRYGRAEVFDAQGNRAPVVSAYEEGVLELTVSAAFLETAAYPVTIDPILTTFPIANTAPAFLADNQWLNPDVAYDVSSDLYVVALENAYSASDHDIYVKAYDTLGQQAGPIAEIDFTGFSWTDPKIANNNIANQFLVVAEETLSGGATVVSGRTVPASIPLAPDAIFQISGPEGGRNPDVGGDPGLFSPTFYCVCWEGYLGGSNIYYNLVQTDSTLVIPFSTYLGFFSTTTFDTRPSISKSNGNGNYFTQNWIIVWERVGPGGDGDIYGAIIQWDGTVIDQGFAVDASSENTTAPAVSSLTDEVGGVRKWLVVYQATQGTPPFGIIHEDLYARVYYGTGPSPTSSIFSYLSMIFPSNTANNDEVNPCIDTDGTRFTIGFTEFASPFAADQGTPHLVTVHTDFDIALNLTEVPVPLNANAGIDDHLQITSKASGGGLPYRYFATWDSVNAANNDRYVEGALWDGWSAVADQGPASYFNNAIPGCGGLNLTMSGFPALGQVLTASLSGVQATPFLIIGTSIPPISLCSGCLLGIDPTTALIIQSDTLTATVPPEGGLVNNMIAIQGADVGSTTGCQGTIPFSLSQEIIITFL